jgi:hypothetical protein
MKDLSLKYEIVPEALLEEAASVYAKTEDNSKSNSFIYALEKGKIFKENDLSPIYLYEPLTKVIYITSIERIENLFH